MYTSLSDMNIFVENIFNPTSNFWSSLYSSYFQKFFWVFHLFPPRFFFLNDSYKFTATFAVTSHIQDCFPV